MPRIEVSFSNTYANEPTVRVPVAEGTTLDAFLETQGNIPDNAKVRLNRSDVEDYDVELSDRDVISVVPTQIKGA